MVQNNTIILPTIERYISDNYGSHTARRYRECLASCNENKDTTYSGSHIKVASSIINDLTEFGYKDISEHVKSWCSYITNTLYSFRNATNVRFIN